MFCFIVPQVSTHGVTELMWNQCSQCVPDEWLEMRMMVDQYVTSYTALDNRSTESRFRKSHLLLQQWSTQKTMKLPWGISSSLSWIVFTLAYLWNIYIRELSYTKKVSTNIRITLMRFCLHKSQETKTKTKLVTTMKEMNPKGTYVLEFRDYDL